MKLSKIVFLFILIIIVFIFINLNTLINNYYFYQAEQKLLFNDFYGAFSGYEKLLSNNDPTINPYLRYRYGNLAVAYALTQRQFNLEPDAKILKRAIEIQIENSQKEWPYFTRNYLLAGELSNYLKNFESALKYLEKARELSPHRPDVYLELAKTYMLSGDYKKSREYLNQAFKYDAQNPQALWQELILNIFEKKDIQENFSKLNAIKYNFLNFSSLSDLAWAYEQAGNQKKAESYRNLIIKLQDLFFSRQS